MNKKGCDHDYENAKRKGRCNYMCPKCWEDITLEVIMIEEAKRFNKKNHE
jgi:hypothetical protein